MTRYPAVFDCIDQKGIGVGDLTSKVASEFDRPGMHQLAFEIQAHKHTRQVRHITPDIIAYSDSIDRRLAIPAGSVALFVVRTDAPFCGMLHKVFASPHQASERDVSVVIDAMRTDRETRRIKFAEEVAERIKASRIVADVYCRNKLLAPELCLFNEQLYGVLLFPWTGGGKLAGQIRVTENFNFAVGTCDDNYSYVLVARAPLLPDNLNKLVQAVPDDYIESHISPPPALALVGMVHVGFMAGTSFFDSVAPIVDASNGLDLGEVESSATSPKSAACVTLSALRLMFEANRP